MGIVFELLGGLFFDFLFAFIFYNTGVFVIRFLTLGFLKKPFLGFEATKVYRQNGLRDFGLPCFVGLIFYVSIITIIIS